MWCAPTGVGVVEALALEVGDGWGAMDVELAHAEEGTDADGVLGGVVGHRDEGVGVGVVEHVETWFVEGVAFLDALAYARVPCDGGTDFLDAVDARLIKLDESLAEGVDVDRFHIMNDVRAACAAGLLLRLGW